MSRPLVVDLFCGAGGASMGYYRAGLDVIGVDIERQPNYPFPFFQADALWFLDVLQGIELDIAMVHASPPCQRYSVMTRRHGREHLHPDLVPLVRQGLIALGLPYVIENVEGAPLIDPVRLCGSSFGLKVRRHRLFEASFPIESRACAHESQGYVVGVYGNPGGRSVRDGLTFGGVAAWREAMGIDWMLARELRESIPPAYTEHIGRHFMRA